MEMEIVKDLNHVRKILAANEERIDKLLPEFMEADSFIQQVISYAHERKDDPKQKLANISKSSLLGGVFQAAGFGLKVGPEADILVYNNNDLKVREANFQENYKGLLTLAYRSGAYKVIDAEPIYKNDPRPTTRKGSDFCFSFEPDYFMRDRGEAIAFYCYTETVTGGRDFTIRNHWQIEARRLKNAKNKKQKTLFWKKHPIPMSLKTVIRIHLKFKPLDDKLSLALAYSGKVANFDETTESLVIAGAAVEPEGSPQSESHSLEQLEQVSRRKDSPPKRLKTPTDQALGNAPTAPRNGEPKNGKTLDYVKLLAGIVDDPNYTPALRALIEDGKLDDPRQLKPGEPNVLRTREPSAAKWLYTQIQTADKFLSQNTIN